MYATYLAQAKFHLAKGLCNPTQGMQVGKLKYPVYGILESFFSEKSINFMFYG